METTFPESQPPYLSQCYCPNYNLFPGFSTPLLRLLYRKKHRLKLKVHSGVSTRIFYSRKEGRVDVMTINGRKVMVWQSYKEEGVGGKMVTWYK